MAKPEVNNNSLSVCLIVKNEEQLLPDCLKSIADITDQIVVVDTGSTDKTVEIARSFGAEIYNFTWVDDFAAARNESLKFAKGQWILCLDADERLDAGSQPILISLVNSKDQSFFYDVCIRNLDQNGDPTNLTTAHRLFPNYKDIRFQGKVHEQISKSARRQGLSEKQSGLILHHLGYGLEEEKIRQKEKRNRKLLKQMLIQQPHNAYTHFTIAQHYDLAGNQQQAYEHYIKALRLKQFQPRLKAALLNSLANLCISMHRLKEAQDYCIQSMNEYPVQCGAYYNLYRLTITEDDKELVISALSELLKNIQLLDNGAEPLPSDVIVNRWQTKFTLGRLYHQVSDLDRAYQTLKPLMTETPDNLELLQRLFDISMRTNRLDEAEGYINRLIMIQGNVESLLQYRGILKIRQKDYSAAIHTYQRILTGNPENREAMMKLIGLYGKIGDMAKAQQLIRIHT